MESAPQVGRVLPFVLYLSSRNTHKVLVSQRGNSYWQVVLIFSFFFFKYRNWYNTAERPETVGSSTDCGLLAVAGEQKYCANFAFHRSAVFFHFDRVKVIFTHRERVD